MFFPIFTLKPAFIVIQRFVWATLFYQIYIYIYMIYSLLMFLIRLFLLSYQNSSSVSFVYFCYHIETVLLLHSQQIDPQEYYNLQHTCLDLLQMESNVIPDCTH